MTALQPITADTTPPPGTTLRPGERTTVNIVTGPGKNDWTKVDAYLPNLNITSPSATLNAQIKPDIVCITHQDADHFDAAGTALSRDMYVFHRHRWMLLLDRANRATTNGTFSIVCNVPRAEKGTTPAIWYGGVVNDPLVGYDKYQTENWDGYGAQPITTETLDFARRIISLLPTSLGAPDMAPTGDGSIALEWIPDDQTHKISKLFVDIGPGQEWCAYWRLRDGRFDTIAHMGVVGSKLMLQALFTQLSK